jgi:electron transfer flavoprotein alpha subunit
MRTLVIAEHDGKVIKSATLNAVSAGIALGSEIDLLVAGDTLPSIPEITGVKRTITASHATLGHELAESLATVIAGLANEYTHILAPATTFGKNVLPRVAALKDVMQISDVVKIHSPDTFDRPIYAGNAIATVQSSDTLKIMTIRPTAFPAASIGAGSASTESLSVTVSTCSTAFIKLEESKSERPELTSARVVVSGGRGLQSGENFKLIEDLADTLHGAVGASRAAVDAGYVPNDFQVGQTGKIVAPELYIAVGISGAIQHLAGMKDSKTIIAINKDPDAPIFQIADFGIVGDLFEIVPQLTKAIRELQR